MEHFGITPIEAASFGCIPVVYGQGGPREVVRTLGCDTAFDTVEECANLWPSSLPTPRAPSLLSATFWRAATRTQPQAYAGGVDRFTPGRSAFCRQRRGKPRRRVRPFTP